jgi:hypothetical protein
MIHLMALLYVSQLVAGCTTGHVVGNDAYATVGSGAHMQAEAQAWCKPYAKVPQLKDQDSGYGRTTYYCIIHGSEDR